MKNFLFFIVVMCFYTSNAKAQSPAAKVPKIAVFSPLYLDSTFGTKGYKYGKIIPSFAIQGVEYYYGAKAAMDSLYNDEVKCHYYIFDSKSTTKPISNLIKNNELDSMDMLIGSVSGMDVKYLADYALQKNIPFVSATFPNVANVTANPNFVILNSTLKSITEKLYNFLSAKLKDQKIVVFTKDGKQEERVLNYIKEMEANDLGSKMNITYANLGTTVNETTILPYVDSTVLTTYVIGSTDVSFAKSLAKTIAKYKLQEQSNMVGLPTWHDADDLNAKEFNGMFFYYITPTLKSSSIIATELGNSFKAKYGSNPSDNMYRGYESIYKFTKLYIKNGKAEFMKYINDTEFSTISNYDIKPVTISTLNATPDYYENKKLTVVKLIDGVKTYLTF
jgi:hypothetical protein